MPTGRLSVVVTRRLPEVVETRMKELFDVELRDDDRPWTRDELSAAMRRADRCASVSQEPCMPTRRFPAP